ncbi:MAG: SgcJ/EcaC family oxidoreductase [Vicinamibacterales bacterium]
MTLAPIGRGRTRACLALTVAALLTMSAAGAGAAQGGRGDDEAAVRALVDRYVEARALEDPAAVEALFTADADQYTTSGEWRRGRAAIVAGTARSSAQNPGTRRIRIDALRFVTRDVAIADGPYEITTPGTATPARRMWTSIVVVRTARGWRISAIRNMVPTGATSTVPEAAVEASAGLAPTRAF